MQVTGPMEREAWGFHPIETEEVARGENWITLGFEKQNYGF